MIFKSLPKTSVAVHEIFENRVFSYDKPHCWQYDIRLSNLEQDLVDANLVFEDISSLKTSDFIFKQILGDFDKRQATRFIAKHEWLGTLSQYTTHWFGAYYKDTLAGVTLLNMPNAFSKMLGKNTDQLERLISRGACISWSPKNLASAFLMWVIKYMVQNTQYRLFTAYSDPQAKEIGIIYQACNFYYLGQLFGAKAKYINPYTDKTVSDRYFRTRTAYKNYAKDLGIYWYNSWVKGESIQWGCIPDDIEKQLRDYSKYQQENAKKIEVPLKHKYAYVLGNNKKETKQLRKYFITHNKTYDYLKER